MEYTYKSSSGPPLLLGNYTSKLTTTAKPVTNINVIEANTMQENFISMQNEQQIM